MAEPTASPTTGRPIPWYYQKWFVVLCLLLFWPVGLILLWRSPVTNLSGRLLGTALVAVVVGYAIYDTIAATEPTARWTVDEIKAAAITPKYDDLARQPEAFIGKPVSFKGEVVQVMGSPSRPMLRVAVTEDQYGIWKDVIWVNAPEGTRVLEEDIIQFWGIFKGEIEYTAVLGQQIRVPEVDAVAIEVVVKAGDRN